MNKNYMRNNKYKKWLKSIHDDLWMLFVLWTLVSSPAVYYWIYEGGGEQALDFACRGFIMSVVLFVILCLLSGKWRNAFSIVLLFLGVINLIADKAVYNICHIPFSQEAVAMMLGTNLSETGEFFSAYVTPGVVIFIILAILLCWVLYFIRGWIAHLSRYLLLPLTLFLIFSVCFVLCNKLQPTFFTTSRWDSVFLGKIHLFAEYQMPEDLTEYRQVPVVIKTSESPAEIVIVIGESVSKSHCSLYGYPHPTNPYLETIRDSLLVFSNVSSAGFHTISSIKQMLSTYDEEQDVPYYECLTIFDVLKEGGYQTFWISNQSESGAADNVVADYAHLADSYTFLGVKGRGFQKPDYDEILIPEFIEQSNIFSDSPKCWFIHMMGCHSSFSLRYPQSEAFFTINSYPEALDNQKAMLMHYDNAIRYGDKVIRGIMETVADRDAVVIFVPDHGQDIYETESTYAGHAKMGEPESIDVGKKIPFLVYCTSEFRQKHQHIYQWLYSVVDIPMNTKDFIPFILNVSGLELAQ